MRKADCLRWAKALINGKHKKLKEAMSNAQTIDDTPTAMCCLGVANEIFKVEDYKEDRIGCTAVKLMEEGVSKHESPTIFDKHAADINDCIRIRIPQVGLVNEEMIHEDIGMLLLFAIESGEYKNI